jgi:hypothetical protein
MGRREQLDNPTGQVFRQDRQMNAPIAGKQRDTLQVFVYLAFVCASSVMSGCSLRSSSTPVVSPSPQPTATPTPTAFAPTVEFPEGWEPSPDGVYAARIIESSRLMVMDSAGGEHELVRSAELTSFSWFPDSRHVIFSERVATQGGFPSGEDRLWLADIASGATAKIANGFAPMVSPDGRRVAFMLGSRVGDACLVGFGLGVAELSEDFRLVSLLHQADIQGMPSSYQAETFFPDWHGDVGFPGSWSDASTVEVAMRWACIEDDPGNGIYRVDVIHRTAEKIAELPGK